MNLIESLREFDGKRTGVLEELSAKLPRNDDSVAQLVAIARRKEERLQVGATWIMKKWVEQGMSAPENLAAKVTQLLKSASHWEVRLHLLQMLVSLPIPTRSVNTLATRLPDLLASDNKLVRAWSLSVFAVIADQSEKLRADFLAKLRVAEKDEAASVRARIRRIQKQFKWAQTS